MDPKNIAALVTFPIAWGIIFLIADRALRQNPSGKTYAILIGLAGAFLLCSAVLFGCSPTARPSAYTVRVQSLGSQLPIPRASVTLEIADAAPLHDLTDSEGYARFEVPESLSRGPARLLVSAEGHSLYTRNTEIGISILPEVVSLVPLPATSPEQPGPAQPTEVPSNPPPTEPTPVPQPLVLPVAPGTPLPTPPGPISTSAPQCEYATIPWPDEAYSVNPAKERTDFGSVVEFFSYQGQPSLALGSNNGHTALYDLSSGQLALLGETADDRITGLAYDSVSSHLFASSNFPTVFKWRLTNPTTALLEADTLVESTLGTLQRPQAMRYAEPSIIVGTQEGTIIALDAGNLGLVQELPRAHAARIWTMDATSDQAHLITAGADNIGYVWPISAGLIEPPVAEVTLVPPAGNGVITAAAAAYLNSTRIFAIATENGYLTLHTEGAPQPSREQIIFLGSGIWSLDFSSDGQLIAAGTEAGDTFLLSVQQILDFYSGKPKPNPVQLPPSQLPAPASGALRVSSLSFSPDGLFIAIGQPIGVSIRAACP